MVRAAGLALLVALIFPAMAHAALISIRGENIDLSANPKFPAPNSSVTITAHVSLESLGKTIIWTVNDDYVTEGIGLTELTIPTGNIGSETRVEATIMDRGQIVGADVYVVRPATVDVLWEGQTYVPPLYHGKPLVNANALATIVAFPTLVSRGREVPQNDINFTWEINGTVDRKNSGYGKSTLVKKPELYSDTMSVVVTAESRDGLVRAQGSADIEPVGPRATIYIDEPLSGVNFNRAVTSEAELGGDEITFRAYPFFSASADSLAYEWRFDGSPITFDTDDPSSATFRRTGDGSGSFTVEVSVANVQLLFERASHAFSLSL